MSAYYYRVRNRKKDYKRKVLGIILVLSALPLIASVVAPSLTGRLGAVIHSRLDTFAGWSALLIPLYLGWMGIKLFSKQENRRIRDSFLFFLVFTFFSCFLSLFHTFGTKSTGGLGGWIGDQVSLFLIHQFGVFTVFLLTIGILFMAGSWLVGVSPLSVLIDLKERVVRDIEDWRAERKKILDRRALRKKLDQLSTVAESSSTPADVPTISTKEPASFKDPTSVTPVSKPMPGIHSDTGPPSSVLKVPLSQAGEPEAHLPPGDIYDRYLLPDPELLTIPEQTSPVMSKDELYANGTFLEKTLDQFHVKAKVVDIHPGPVITRYDLTPAAGVRVQSIEALANDIALAMKAQSLRVLAPVPGKAAIGIEISNSHPAPVYLKEILLSAQFKDNSMDIPFGMGKTAEGDPFVSDLASMPHLLIAGATGSGKSVSIHGLILSFLFRFKPDALKMLLIDPKRLELPVYDGLPHLYDPSCTPEEVKVVTQPKEVVASLKKLIEVMEERYKNFAKLGVRNIQSYNEKAEALKIKKEAYLVVVIDELADLMVTVGKEIEDLIQRLAQMARAVGIHLVLATQRPSVDVITGVIKANLPSRAAFQVLSKTDSRVILDSQGAEDLLGRGDMLFLATGAPRPIRLQGSFVSEGDVNRVVEYIKEQNFKPQYSSLQADPQANSIVDNEENQNLLFRAARVVRDTEKVSGDLLRADKEIGSKYDLALSLLKKRGLIEKPKDSNRWKIHFDRLDEFLNKDGG